MPEQLADPDAAAALAERDGQSTATQLAGAEGVGPQSRGMTVTTLEVGRPDAFG